MKLSPNWNVRGRQLYLARVLLSRRGRLAWLVALCRDDWQYPQREGERLDLVTDILVFTHLPIEELQDLPLLDQGEVETLRGHARQVLSELFSLHTPKLGLQADLVIAPDSGPVGRPLPSRKGAVVRGVVRRLPLPLRLDHSLLQPTVANSFRLAAALEIVAGSRRVSRCARCEDYFLRDRRQEFCSPRCSQASRDARRRRRRRR